MDVDAAYLAFKKERDSDLKRIANRTNGDLSEEDLASEAWFVAGYHAAKRGFPIDWKSREDQELILGTLTVQHVWRKNGERKRTISADHVRSNQDDDIPALINLLPSWETDDPLVLLERREEEESEKAQREAEDAALESYSESVAYIILLWHFDNICNRAAAYLVIDRGTLRHRIAFANKALKIQASLFDGIEQIDDAFMPRRGVVYASRLEPQHVGEQWTWEF